MIARSNAVNLAVKNMEMALATDYDYLYSYTTTSKVDNIDYMITTSVTKYSDNDFDKEDLVKEIDVQVEYMLNGENLEYSVKSLKGKVL